MLFLLLNELQLNIKNQSQLFSFMHLFVAEFAPASMAKIFNNNFWILLKYEKLKILGIQDNVSELKNFYSLQSNSFCQ